MTIRLPMFIVRRYGVEELSDVLYIRPFKLNQRLSVARLLWRSMWLIIIAGNVYNLTDDSWPAALGVLASPLLFLPHYINVARRRHQLIRNYPTLPRWREVVTRDEKFHHWLDYAPAARAAMYNHGDVIDYSRPDHGLGNLPPEVLKDLIVTYKITPKW